MEGGSHGGKKEGRKKIIMEVRKEGEKEEGARAKKGG